MKSLLRHQEMIDAVTVRVKNKVITSENNAEPFQLD